jgi:hypothetical protein
MGVRVTIREGDTRSVSGGGELTVVVLPRRPPSARLDHTVMGATHRTRDGVRAIWAYAGGVGATLGLDLARRHEWRPVDRREFGVALGRVVAHELIHAVTPDRPHVRGGLMAERMGRPLLLAPRLAIDTVTAEAFRQALAGNGPAADAMATMPGPTDTLTVRP